jgi:hypothetical protein
MAECVNIFVEIPIDSEVYKKRLNCLKKIKIWDCLF